MAISTRQAAAQAPQAPPPEAPIPWTAGHTAGVILVVAATFTVAWFTPLQGRVWGWLAVMLLFVLLTGTIGLGVRGRFWGILIDERRMISLSRLQMVAWTTLVLSAWVVATLTNMRHELVAHPTDIAIPQILWVLMGISTTSLVGSPLIKSMKASAVPTRRRDRPEYAVGELAMNGSSRDANLGDLFRGEEVGNYNRTDLGKVQMFYFTAILLAVYGIALANQLFEPVAVTEFPDLDQSMIALLAISHAGYLSYKAVPKSKG